MSAICGIFNLDGKAVQQKELEVMMSKLSHHGLDGSNIVLNGSIGFGHQMYHIWENDHHEKLPFHDQEKKLIITCNARLNNREELMKSLCISSSQEYIPNSILILKSYEKWKEDLADHLFGSFMIVIWDQNVEQLIFVSDFTGHYALFYHKNANQLIFASEIRAILAINSVSCRLNKEFLALALSDSLAFLHFPELTYFEEIQSMTSRTVMIINSQNTRILDHKKLDIHHELNIKNEKEWIEQFQDLLFKITRSLVNSRYPIVSLLSGGLDSSCVTAFVAKILKEKNQTLHTLSAVLPEDYAGNVKDERDYIDQMKVYDNLQMHYISDPWRGPFDDLQKRIEVAERFGIVSRHFLFSAFAEKSAHLKARVLIEGGMGEMGPSFHSNVCMADLLYQGKWSQFFKEFNCYAQLRQKSMIHMIRFHIIHNFMPIRIQTRNIFKFEMMKQYYPVQKEFLKHVSFEKLSELRKNKILSNAVYLNHRKNQVYSMLKRGRISPHNSFEGYECVQLCKPFADRRMIEFCLASPIWMKLKNGYTRYMIRAGMKNMVPEKIRWRTTKNPFSVDYNERYAKGIKLASEVLNNIKKNDPVNEIIDVEKAKNYLKIQMNSRRGNSKDLVMGLHIIPNVIQLCYFLRRFKEFQE